MTMRLRSCPTIKFEEGWDIIEKGVLKVTECLKRDLKDEISESLMYKDIYTTIYKMCNQKPPHCYSQQLYDKYSESFQEYITLTVLPALREVDDEFMLREFVKCWENHKVMLRFMSNMFYCLDIYFVEEMSLDSLAKVGILSFRELVYHDKHVNVKNVVIDLINREREGEQIDRALLRNAFNIFVEIGMDHMDFYKNDFEAPLLEDTGTYYSRKAALWVLEDSCTDYMLKAEECLKHEKEIVSHYLHFSTEQTLIEKVENEILSHYQTQLLEKEDCGNCEVLFRDHKKDDLSRMYRLFCRIPNGLEPIANTFKQHLITLVEDVVKNDAEVQEHAFVAKIIELHDKYMDYVVDAFQNHSIFKKAFKEVFELICNKRVGESTCAELIATFCDNVLKKGGNDNNGSILEKAVNLVNYISDKDLFAEFYRTKLANRLLLSDKRANENHELTILSKIKHHCGSNSTSKMQGMVNDFTLSMETQADFRTYLEDHSNSLPGLELAVTVLTTPFWPTYNSSQNILPLEMIKCIEVFTSFYSTKYNQRKLTWLNSMGNCSIIGNFDSKPIEITVSTYQAILLLLFNDSERLSYEEIKSELKLEDEDVFRLLHSVLKHKILLKQPNNKTITKTDYFEINPNFTLEEAYKSKKRAISFSLEDEKKKVAKVVKEDRRYVIDAAMVRIMKNRKVLRIQELLSECVKELQRICDPDNKLMQERIKDLIDRAYMERDQENSNIIRYLP